MARFHIPEWRLVQSAVTETGEVYWVVTHTCKRVNALTTPTGFYDFKRAASAVGRFYECYIAYLLGGTKTFNPNAQCPDVQLPSADGILEKHLLFEVKAGHRTNGIVLKKNQLDIFETLMNCYYAVVFHQSKDIQARWSEGRKSQQAIRKELENPSSIFIVPPQLMLEFYIAHLKSAQPLPRCWWADEKYVSMKESHMRELFDRYDWDRYKIEYGKLRIISNELIPDPTDEKRPFIIRT